MKKCIVFCLVVLMSAPFFVSAETIIRSGNSVSVEANQTLEGNFYGSGNRVLISGAAQHDVYVSGISVTINGPVAGDVSVAGLTVRINGPVAGDVRIIGNDIEVASPVSGDLVAIGGAVRVLSTGSVDGNIIMYGGELEISGPVKGYVYGTANTIRLNAEVTGDVTVRAHEALSLGDRAALAGNLSYTSRVELVRAQNAQVTGKITHEAVAPLSTKEVIQSLAVQVLVVLFAVLTAYVVARRPLERLVEGTTARYGLQGLIGLLSSIATPFIAFLLLMSVLGSIVGLALALFYIFLMLVAWTLSGIMLAGLFRQLVLKKSGLTIPSVALGTAVVVILPIIPYVGSVLLLFLMMLTTGGLILTLYTQTRR